MFGKRLYFILTIFFFVQFAQAQLSNFTLTVVKTDETCTSNGSLTFSVSNTTPGSTILYSIYLLPNVTTPISVQSSGSISGLSAGTYRVVATQSLGNDSGSQQQDIIISNNIHALTYQVSSQDEICGNDGIITVSATSGTPVSYEIFAGPMTRPLQSSNTFTGLTAGVYQIRVFDNCNQGVVQTYTLGRLDSRLNFSLINPYMATCTTVAIGFSVSSLVPTPNGVIKYPLQIVTTLFLPSGPSAISGSLTGGNGFSILVPYNNGQSYNYSFDVTDGCGVVYHLSGTIQNLTIGQPAYTIAPDDCTHKLVAFSNVMTLILQSAPAGYPGGAPHDFTPAISNNFTSVGGLTAGTYVFVATDLCGTTYTFTIQITIDNTGNPPTFTVYARTCTDASLLIFEIQQQLIMVSSPTSYGVAMPHDYSSLINTANYAGFVHLPIGTYVFNVIDRCGNPVTLTILIEPLSTGPTPRVLEGCDTGVGSVQLLGQLVSISLTAAPAAYGASLPVNMTGSVTSNGTLLTLDSLPPGNYTFESTNSCNQSFTTNFTINGYQDNTIATLTPNCGSFNFNLNHSSNNNSGATFWLQKFNSANNTWGHPLTNVGYSDGTIPTTTNSVQLTNNATTFNLAYSGHFRILKVYNGYSLNNPQSINCFKTIYEFDFSDGPRINDIYSVSCGSTFEVIVNAQGNSALIYRITTKDGQPFLIENGSSSLFTGLAPATYNFQVEDACGNRVNGQFQITNPNPMLITPSATPCPGGVYSLTVPNFAFLTYQWWKDNNTAVILATTNSLNFAAFNPALNNGTYHVRITYSGNPNSCLNQVLDYTVTIGNDSPHAGNDNAVSYCGRQGTMDLTSLLTGTFDTTGTWTEITSSGMLTNNLWNSSSVSFGTYQFRYTVSGSCNQTAAAAITIILKSIPQIPVASADPIVCETQDLNLFATTVAGGVYHWAGPNGFTSSEQNPIIHSITPSVSGTYVVYSTQNGCQSGNSSVIVQVNPQPDFVLNQDCEGREYKVWATKITEDSFDEATSTFSWSGPNGFSSSQNPITISGGDTGIYTLTITNQSGCPTTKSIEVLRTTCFIPNVITPNNDDTNESFDLTGFDVKRLEIYNRWGRKVYEKNNYLDEWHGQNMNGDKLPDSTYYYLIELPEEGTKTGWIFLNSSR